MDRFSMCAEKICGLAPRIKTSNEVNFLLKITFPHHKYSSVQSRHTQLSRWCTGCCMINPNWSK